MSDGWSDADIRALLTPQEYAAASKPVIEEGAQGSVEWLMERVGHVTCSRFGDVLDFGKSGTKESAKRAAYRKQVVIERVTGKPLPHFVSGPMRDGIEREPLAKMAYEARTGRLLQDHGFQRHPMLEWVGGSPDALIGALGGLECKCPTAPVHLDTLLGGMDADEHMPQVQGLIWIFGVDWWDFCSYCPMFEEPLRTYIQRVPRDDAYIVKLEAGVLRFLDEVAAQVEVLNKLCGIREADCQDERQAA